MRPSDRRALRELYRFCCGYCGTTEIDAGGELTVDHFWPQSAGGSDTPDNWVYSCIICNDYKGDYWDPNSLSRILHPQRDLLTEHIREEEGVLVALTDTGRFHIQRLRLNRPQLVAQRQRSRELQRIRERLARLEEENAALRHHIQAVGEQIDLLLEQITRRL